MDCVFCEIVKGNLPCHKIYEDEWTVAFLDITNDVFGHTLVVPKQHCTNILDCSQDVLCKVMQAVQKVCNHYIDNCGFDGVNIINANNKEAQQSVFHLHFHIIPRKSGDNLDVFPKFDGCKIELQDVCKQITMLK